MQSINEILAKELNISEKQVKSVVELLDDGNTVPFIARYRKEKTGGLSDEILRIFFERLTYLRGLENKKEDIGSVTFVDKVKNIQKTVSVTPIIHDSYPFLKAQGLLIKFIKTNDTDWQTNSEEKYTYEFNEFGDWITRITHKKNKNGDYTISGGTYREFLSLEDIKTNNN